MIPRYARYECPCCLGDPGTVCDACGEHACWAGLFMCGEAQSAGTAPDYHIGRSWTGHELEDSCPCTKATCGLVRKVLVDPTCPEHPDARVKTMRQVHLASRCPSERTPNP